MATPGIFSKTGQNAALFATFVAGSAALIAGKKGIMWAGNKAYNMAAYCENGMMSAGKWTGNTFMDGAHFTLKDGGIAGPTSAGILAGTAIGLTYKYSAIAASYQLPIKKPGHEIGNRAIVMATSVFVLTLLAIRYSNSKFSSHQMSLAGALSYATIASIITVRKTSDEEQPAANYISNQIRHIRGGINPKSAKLIAHAIENSQYKGQALEILNTLFTEHDIPPNEIEMIFSRLTQGFQAEIKESLLEEIQQQLPATASEIQEFWASLDEETPAKSVSELVNRHRLTQSTAKRCAQYIEAYEGGRQVLTILNALVQEYSSNPESVAEIFTQLSRVKQRECREELSEAIQRFLPLTAADNMRFWQELDGTPAEQIFAELPHSEYEELDAVQAQRLGFFIENYQKGGQIATILNALLGEHEVSPSLIGQIMREISEEKLLAVRVALYRGLQMHVPLASAFDMEMKEDYGVRPSMHADSDAFSWNESAQMGIYAGLASGVATAVAYLGVKSIFAFGEAFPMVKGSIPAAIIVAPTYMMAKGELSKEKYHLNKRQKKLYSMAIAVILGTMLTPTLSSFMLKKKVGYLASTGYSLAPFAASFLMSLASSGGGSSRREFREDRY